MKKPRFGEGQPGGLGGAVNSRPGYQWERAPWWNWRNLFGGDWWRKQTGDHMEDGLRGLFRSGPVYKYATARTLARETLASQFDPDKQWGVASQAPTQAPRQRTVLGPGPAQQKGSGNAVGTQNRPASQERGARLLSPHRAPEQRAIPPLAGVEGLRNRPDAY